MKVLLAGATGNIGRIILDRCLVLPEITTVVTLTRRNLPEDVASNPKIQSMIVSDWTKWPEELLSQHHDAVSMLWALGTWELNADVDYVYPLAFQDAFLKSWESHHGARPPRFRFVLLSGKSVTQDQDAKLYFLNDRRKIKGRLEAESIELAQHHQPWWELRICKAAGVVTKKMYAQALLSFLLGESWSVHEDELAAFMAYLAIGGEEADTVVLNPRIVHKGQEELDRIGW